MSHDFAYFIVAGIANMMWIFHVVRKISIFLHQTVQTWDLLLKLNPHFCLSKRASTSVVAQQKNGRRRPIGTRGIEMVEAATTVLCGVVAILGWPRG